ncbi:MAG: UbiA family prenyltransferase [Planctomycetota bacterium]|nr:UbiA family prenyltransferase [Planctomycetaceae bacterium]MDQ3331469.1 UbiA family prenyltransferase [Planctomycetota bacterium]
MIDDTPKMEPAATSSVGPVRSWLQLVRLPAVFTALADICAGHACKTSSFQPVGPFAALLTSSACLYLAGMVFNDVFDRRRDAIGRPGRPIPSGRIGVFPAIVVGALLIAAGIGSAASVSRQALLISLALTACIFAYDALLKATLLGPIAMGGCRFLNVMLGAAIDDVSTFVWAPPQLYVATAIGIYVAGITWFARTEERTSGRLSLIGGAVVANLGMAILAGAYSGQAAILAWQWAGEVRPAALVLLVVAIAFTVDRRLIAAISNPSPALVQGAVKLMLLSIITLDASAVLAASGNVMLAFATALLVVPAIIFGRWVYLT